MTNSSRLSDSKTSKLRNSWGAVYTGESAVFKGKQRGRFDFGFCSRQGDSLTDVLAPHLLSHLFFSLSFLPYFLYFLLIPSLYPCTFFTSNAASGPHHSYYIYLQTEAMCHLNCRYDGTKNFIKYPNENKSGGQEEARKYSY